MSRRTDHEASISPSKVAEGAEEASRRFRRARLLMWVSAALLCVSLFAVVACTRVEWSGIVPYLMWNHVAIIVMVAAGTLASRRSGKIPSARVSPRPSELFAPPVLIVALLVAATAIPNWGPSPWDMGYAPDGSVVTHHHWHASLDGSSHFESFNRGADLEITKARYDELNRGLFSTFARMWVVFSFVALILWRFVALRRRPEREAHNTMPPARATSSMAVTSPGWKSTALIVAVWTVAIGANLIGLVQGTRREICSMPLPQEMRLVILAMPLLFFGGAALFMKRSPFVSPWIASLVDERLGAGSSESFTTRLRPLLLFSVAGLVGSAAMAKACSQGGGGQTNWTTPGFLASASVAFALAHLILRWRRVPGV